MSDLAPETPNAPAPAKGFAGKLQKKIGPFPLWLWLGLGAGAVMLMMRGSGTGGAAGDGQPTGDSPPADVAPPDGIPGGGAGGNTGGFEDPPPDPGGFDWPPDPGTSPNPNPNDPPNNGANLPPDIVAWWNSLAGWTDPAVLAQTLAQYGGPAAGYSIGDSGATSYVIGPGLGGTSYSPPPAWNGPDADYPDPPAPQNTLLHPSSSPAGVIAGATTSYSVAPSGAWAAVGSLAHAVQTSNQFGGFGGSHAFME